MKRLFKICNLKVLYSVSGLLCLLVVIGLFAGPVFGGDTPLIEHFDLVESFPGQLQLGDTGAPVVLTEYSDFRCFFCQRFGVETFPEIFREYILTGKLLFQFRFFPVGGEQSVELAKLGICLDQQDKFWQFKTLFMERFYQNRPSELSSELQVVLDEIDYQAEQLDSCRESLATDYFLRETVAEAREKAVRSTPTVFINQTKVVGARPFEEFQEIIEQQLDLH